MTSEQTKAFLDAVTVDTLTPFSFKFSTKEIFNAVHSRKRLWTVLHIRLNRGRMLLL